MIDGSLGGDDLKGKYVFWDIDGTLAPYRFNDHVADPEGTDNGQSLGEIENHIFLTRKPSAQMIYIVRNCGAKKNLIMGHCRVQQEVDDKQLWLDRYFPMIERSCRLLVSESSSKADCIIGYCKAKGIPLEEVVYVDDVIPFLREAERKGIKSYHISSFLDWNIVTYEQEKEKDSL